MGESDSSDEERMHQLFKEEVQRWVGQVVEGLEIFAKGDPQAEGDRVEQRENLQNLASDIMGECEAMIGGLQGREEAIGMTRESLEEIQRLLEDFCQLAEEEYGNREEQVSPAVREIIKEVEARLEKGEEEEAATVLRENWRRLIEASGGDRMGFPRAGFKWESWSRRFEEAKKKVKEAEEKLEQAREVEQKAKEERGKVLASLLWRNEQWEQAIKEFGRGEEEQVAQKDVEALQKKLDEADKRVTDAQEHRKARENELETARRELENWNPEFERMTQAPGGTHQIRTWVLAVSESDDVEKEWSKARRKQADCECRLFLAEGLHHLAAATQGLDAAERELEEALEEWNTCEKELKEAEEELRRCCIVADDPPSAQKALERCKEGVKKARLVALEECCEALEREWKSLEECEKTEQREREPLKKALGAWAKLRLKRAEDEWDRVMQELEEFNSSGVPARDAVEALKSRVEKCEKELKAAKDMCPTEGPVERVLTLEGLEELVKSELELEKCKEELERTLHDWNEWRREPWEARRRLGLAVQEWAAALPKAEAAGAGWERVRDATHRAARLVEAGKQALSRAERRKDACQAVVKTCEEALHGASLRSPLDDDEGRRCQENLNQWRQESARWEAEELKCAEELAQIKSELQPLFSAQRQLQWAKEDLAKAKRKLEEASEKCEEASKEWEEAKKECEWAKRKLEMAKEMLERAKEECEEARQKVRELEEASEKCEEAERKEREAKKKWEEANKKWVEADKEWVEADKEWVEAKKKWEEAREECQEAKKKLWKAEKKWEEPKQKVRECEEKEREAQEALSKAQNALGIAEEKLKEANQKADEAELKVQECGKEVLQKARERWEKVQERGVSLLETPDFQSLERSLEQALTNTPWEPSPAEARAWAAVCKQYRNWKTAQQKVVTCEEAARKRAQELREALHQSEETCLRRQKMEREASKGWKRANDKWKSAKEVWVRADNAVKEATKNFKSALTGVGNASKNLEEAENSRKDAEKKLEEANRVGEEAEKKLQGVEKAKEEAEGRRWPTRDRNKTEEQELEARDARLLGAEQGDLDAAMEDYEMAVQELKEATEEPSEEAEEKLERAQRKVEVQNAKVIGAAETSLEKAIAEREEAKKRIKEAQEAKVAAEEAKDAAERELEDKRQDYQRWSTAVEEARQRQKKAKENIKTTRETLQKARQELRDQRATLARKVGGKPVTSAAQNSLWTEEGYQKAREEWNKAWDDLKRAEEELAGAETGLAKARLKPGASREEIRTTKREWQRARKKWTQADENLEKARKEREKINQDLETAEKKFNQARDEWMRAWDNFQATSQALGASRQGEYGDASEDLEWAKEDLEWAREDLGWAREPWHQARTKLVMFYGWQGTPAADLPWPERVFEQAWKWADKAKKKVEAAKSQAERAEGELKDTQDRLEETKKAMEEANREVTPREQSLDAVRQRRVTSARAYLQVFRRRRALEQLRHLLNRVPNLETLRNENPAVDTASSSASDTPQEDT